MEKGNGFTNWAAKGIQQIRHIWDIDEEEWRSALELLRTTRSRQTNNLRTELLSRIPRKPNQTGAVEVGQWITQGEEARPTNTYQVISVQEGTITTEIYNERESNTALVHQGKGQIQINAARLYPVRVTHRNTTQILGFNPREPPPPNTSIWLHNPCRVEDITWDPGEWQWKPAGQNPSKNLFTYNTKQGYRYGITNRIKPTRYEVKLRRQGCSDQARQAIYRRM